MWERQLAERYPACVVRPVRPEDAADWLRLRSALWPGRRAFSYLFRGIHW